MAEKRRMFKVSERIREIVAGCLPRSADPRFVLVTITGVIISSDLREAKIYWTAPNAKDKLDEFEKAFKKANGYFRRAVAEGLDIRFVPNLHFIYDDTMDTYDKVQELIAKIPPEDLAPRDVEDNLPDNDEELADE